ncbi:hypothetical protein J4Q44_G00017910 [Coregonus suidteri]|uniref:Uncharacterized protein n=1 Tax=Coregonus suidteri TaxID=861788 RepID=A0AAN8NF21_9TELE
MKRNTTQGTVSAGEDKDKSFVRSSVRQHPKCPGAAHPQVTSTATAAEQIGVSRPSIHQTASLHKANI